MDRRLLLLGHSTVKRQQTQSTFFWGFLWLAAFAHQGNSPPTVSLFKPSVSHWAVSSVSSCPSGCPITHPQCHNVLLSLPGASVSKSTVHPLLSAIWKPLCSGGIVKSHHTRFCYRPHASPSLETRNYKAACLGPRNCYH